MAQWNYDWQSDGKKLTITLDLSNVRLDTIPYYIGGMGLTIENTSQYIEKVMINGAHHPAFSDRTIILPNLSSGKNTIEVTLSPHQASQSRLTYVSKRMPSIVSTVDGLECELLTKSKARFNFVTEKPSVVLHADYQEYDYQQRTCLKGYVTSDRKVLLKPLATPNFSLSRVPLTILSIEESNKRLTMKLQDRAIKERALYFYCTNPPQRVMLGAVALEVEEDGARYYVALPNFDNTAELVMYF
jgi:hypothetical protein